MNILWITPESPFPTDNGHRYVYANRIKGFCAMGHSITLCSVAEDNADDLHLYKAKDYVDDFFLSPKELLSSSAPGLSILPRHIRKKSNRDLSSRIASVVAERHPDVIVIESTNMAQYLPENAAGALTILNVHNIDNILLWRSMLTQSDIRSKVRFACETMKTYLYESHLYSRSSFDLYSFVSMSEEHYVRSRYRIADTIYAPIGVTDNYHRGSTPSGKRLVFVGNLSYSSNIESIRWFVMNCYPELLTRINDLELLIVGKQPTQAIYDLADKYQGIRVVADVPDVFEYISTATAIIAPIISGAGVKVKILEALSAAKIVVTTELGVEGTPFIHNKHVLVAGSKNPRAFTSTCHSILTDPRPYTRAAKSGYSLVMERYSWNAVNRTYEQMILQSLEQKRLKDNRQ